ncbi:MAG: hypothetical protein ACT4PZ_19500 [Panacagrimonas sp.]
MRIQRRHDIPRQHGIDLVDRALSDASEDMTQMGLWIHVPELGGTDQAVGIGRALAATVGAAVRRANKRRASISAIKYLFFQTDGSRKKFVRIL